MIEFEYYRDWPEILSFLLLVVGVFVALFAGSAVIVYTLITLVGMMGGRVWYRIKEDLKWGWSVIMLGFLVGFVIGNRYGTDVLIILFYLGGFITSYVLHDKEIIFSREM